MGTRGTFGVCAAAVFCVVYGATMPLQAGDGKSPDDVRKVVREVRKALRGEIDRMLEEGEKALTARLVKLLEADKQARIGELEKALAERDAKIARLEARIKTLEAGKGAPAAPAFLGVGHVDPPDSLLKKLGVPGGALVTQVLADSPAAAAGLQVGDVIVALGDKPVTSESLGGLVSEQAPGSEVAVTYLRDDRKIRRKTKLVAREGFLAKRVVPARPVPAPKERTPVVLGLHIVEGEGGIRVDAVEKGFTGDAAKLKEGDRLLAVNGKEVKVIDDVRRELGRLKEGDTLRLKYARGPEIFEATVVGAHGKGKARLEKLATIGKPAPAKPKPVKKPQPKPVKKPVQPKAVKKPQPLKKPAFLGVAALPAAGGLRVELVVAGSPAARAGIQPQDVLRKVDGKAVTAISQLQAVIARHGAGEKVRVEIQRDGKTLQLEVTLSARPQKNALKVRAAKRGQPERLQAAPGKPQASGKLEKPSPSPSPKPKPKPKQEKPGPRPGKPGRLGVNASQSKDDVVSVKTVFPNSPAARGGLREGDVIAKAGGKEIRTLDDLAAVLQKLRAGDKLSLEVRRDGTVKKLTVTLGKPYADESLSGFYFESEEKLEDGEDLP